LVGRKLTGLHTEVTYEKPELPDVRKVDAGLIQSEYKHCPRVSEGLRGIALSLLNRSELCRGKVGLESADDILWVMSNLAKYIKISKC